MVTAEIAKQQLAIHGEVRSQPPSDWSGAYSLPPAVEQFYLDVGPANLTIEGYGNPYFLPCLRDLWSFQAGYRWNGLTGDPIVGWNGEWLVVADEGGDPFIFDQTSGAVLHAYLGEGVWDARETFPDLNTMAACLALVGAIFLKAGHAFLDRDCSIQPKFRALAMARLRELLGSKAEAESVLDELGWH